MKGKKIGFGITGSFCTHEQALQALQLLVDAGADVYPFITDVVATKNTRYGTAHDLIQKLEEISKKSVISTIEEAELFGPRTKLDCMVIAPMTGNSMSKFANAHNDNAVLMAAKATLRNLRPVVLAVSTNDALGLGGMNLMRLMATKNIFFVPFGQDDPDHKPNSLISDLSYLNQTIEKALEGKQLQPVIICYKQGE